MVIMTNLCALAVLCVGVNGTRYQPTNKALWVTDTIASATNAHTQKSLCWVLELRHDMILRAGKSRQIADQHGENISRFSE